ncbi:hypothetical protein D3C71_328820 [compost metagenome]
MYQAQPTLALSTLADNALLAEPAWGESSAPTRGFEFKLRVPSIPRRGAFRVFAVGADASDAADSARLQLSTKLGVSPDDIAVRLSADELGSPRSARAAAHRAAVATPAKPGEAAPREPKFRISGDRLYLGPRQYVLLDPQEREELRIALGAGNHKYVHIRFKALRVAQFGFYREAR